MLDPVEHLTFYTIFLNLYFYVQVLVFQAHLPRHGALGETLQRFAFRKSDRLFLERDEETEDGFEARTSRAVTVRTQELEVFGRLCRLRDRRLAHLDVG